MQFFYWDRGAEVSFPFQILNEENNQNFTLDMHYRKFLGEAQKGFYLSGFGRYGYLSQKYLSSETATFLENKNFTDSRFGIGVGIGYRIYSKSGLYWGTSFNIGRYLIYAEPADDLFQGLGFLSGLGKGIFDIELLKFGYAF